jgi:hypothetical protein
VLAKTLARRLARRAADAGHGVLGLLAQYGAFGHAIPGINAAEAFSHLKLSYL